jgi:kinetochore protein Nuf2
MIATKEFQTTAVQEVEELKAEKNTLIKRKASSLSTIRFL